MRHGKGYGNKSDGMDYGGKSGGGKKSGGMDYSGGKKSGGEQNMGRLGSHGNDGPPMSQSNYPGHTKSK